MICPTPVRPNPCHQDVSTDSVKEPEERKKATLKVALVGHGVHDVHHMFYYRGQVLKMTLISFIRRRSALLYPSALAPRTLLLNLTSQSMVLLS